MNLSTKTSLHRNNTLIIQTRIIPKTSKQTHNNKKNIKTSTQILTKMKLKIQDMRWENKSPYLFLEDLEVNKCNNGGCREWHEVFGRDSVERKWIVTKSLRENWKGLKTDLVFAKHAIFVTEVSRQQVARSSRQNTQRQNCEKFSKWFSQLEGLPASESWAELRKSLCTPRDWTLHSWISHQNQHASLRL